MSTTKLFIASVLILSLRCVSPATELQEIAYNPARGMNVRLVEGFAHLQGKQGSAGVSSQVGENRNAIAALSGTIVLNFTDGRPSIQVNAGTGIIVDNEGNPVKDANGNTIQSLADLLKSDTSGSIKSAISSAVTGIAQNVVAAGGNAEAVKEATSQLAAVMKTMSQADPAGISALVSTAVSTLTAGGASSTTVTNAVAAVVAGATSNSDVSAEAVKNAAITAASGNSVTLPENAVSAAGANQVVNAGVITTTPQPIDVSVVSRGS